MLFLQPNQAAFCKRHMAAFSAMERNRRKKTGTEGICAQAVCLHTNIGAADFSDGVRIASGR